jgi:hypothetical protein
VEKSMKKIVKKIMVPKYIEVQSDEFENVTTYETFDGKMFDSKDDAEHHETKLKFSKLREESLQYDFPDVSGSWYKANTEADLQFLKDYFVSPYDISHGMDTIKVGEWFCVSVDYGGDCKDSITFITKSNFKALVKDLLDHLS